ncbi:nitroreductase family protein [Hymenobacter sp. BRD67]|uniref:nitroreductase family protein n=1 Tax=Hymenobacter sp. BRD67 TaxID=2675877 RepID=UPI0015630FB0|nr:nitroreductase family protein [Hymenobacter sp. BRD67]QKG53136.1 nitroreductase family protein [Hymenobacter sp. BRD67]
MSDLTNVLTSEHPILPQLAQRRSPRAYTSQPVAAEALQQLFTAAGSAASCFGEQPWRFIVGSKATSPEAFGKILATLGEFNQVWVKDAPVLAISIAKATFSHDNNPNAWARHDVGQAVATLAIQAVELGLQIHQMAGFSPEAARTAFSIPAGYDAVAVFTIGYPSAAATVPESLRERELAPRSRKPLAEFMFEGGWPQVQDERYDQAPV